MPWWTSARRDLLLLALMLRQVVFWPLTALQDEQALVLINELPQHSSLTVSGRQGWYASSVTRIEPQNTTRGLYSNPHEVVHVIHTRFMQHQKDLDHLAKARLDLFQTFTLPSMRQQTNSHFLWIIWMEPFLDESAKQDFLNVFYQKMEPHFDCLVIGSNFDEYSDNSGNNNNNHNIPSLSSPFYDSLLQSSVYGRGSLELLHDYRQAAQSRVVLETVLDADDAVFYDFTSSLQQEAVQSLQTTSMVDDFRVWCAPQTLQWGYYDPYFVDKHHVDDVDGKHKINKNKTNFATKSKSISNYRPGHLSRSPNYAKTTKICPSGGFTRGWAAGSKSNDNSIDNTQNIPRHLVHRHLPPCDYSPHKCLARLQGRAAGPAVLRTRTPMAVEAAQGMPRRATTVMTGTTTQHDKDNNSNNNNNSNDQDSSWRAVQHNFGVSRASVVELQTRIEANMVPILLDGLQGVCQKGHVCRHADKDALKLLKRRYKSPQRYGGALSTSVLWKKTTTTSKTVSKMTTTAGKSTSKTNIKLNASPLAKDNSKLPPKDPQDHQQLPDEQPDETVAEETALQNNNYNTHNDEEPNQSSQQLQQTQQQQQQQQQEDAQLFDESLQPQDYFATSENVVSSF